MSKAAVWVIRNFEPQLNALLAAIRKFEEYLGPEDDWIEDDRRVLFEAIDGLFGYSTVYDIDDTDYVFTVNASPDGVEEILYAEEYKRNLVSGRKRREIDGKKQYAHGSWAKYSDGGEKQHHVWLFETPAGNTDIYAHYEDNVTDSAGHLHVRDDEDDVVGMKRAYPGALPEIFESHKMTITDER